MIDHTTTDSMSRRNVLKATGGLLAGATLFAGSGAAATEADPGLRFEIEDATEEVIVARVHVPEEINERTDEPGAALYLGLADDFIVRDGRVSLPENTEGLAQPVEMEASPGVPDYIMYFHTRDIDFSEVEGEEVTLGLGVFPNALGIRPKHFDRDEVRFEPLPGVNV